MRKLSFSIALTAAACTGSIGADGDGNGAADATPGRTSTGGTSGAGSAGGGAQTSAPGAERPGMSGAPRAAGAARVPLRRLSATEYRNTVRDLLGPRAEGAALAIAADDLVGGFDNNADAQSVPPVLAEQYVVAAESLAALAVADLPKLLGCTPAAAASDPCVRGFLAAFGKRAWRRPLAPAEIDRLARVHAAGAAAGGATAGVQTALEALLASPHFLYRIEVGAPGAAPPGAMRLSPWETATRLSYLFLRSMPDEALFAAAEKDELATPEQLAAQARRLLQSPRARATVNEFHAQWLAAPQINHLEKDAKVVPGFGPEIVTRMRQQLERFVDFAAWESGADPLGTLLRSPVTFVDGRLAAYLGISGVTGTAFTRVELDKGRAAGALTHPGLLALFAKPDQTSPVYRGKFVREQLLCTAPPAPPPGLDTTPPDLDPRLTTRERFTRHRDDPSCASCHALMDPIGLGFEGYDAGGRFRATENGRPIDASGEIFGSDVPGPFVGPAELGARLAASADVRRCATRQWLRFAFGRVEAEGDDPTLASLAGAAQATLDPKALLVALVATDAFRFRPAPPSSTQGGTK